MLLASGGAWAADVAIVPTAGGPSSITTGPNTVVTTTSVNTAASVGFNKFDSFSVGTGQSATLVLPNGTDSVAVKNLVNIVRDQASIAGLVQTRLGSATGAVGGNLIFVVPSGLVVAAGGSINTGRLIVRGTPNGSTTDTPSLTDVLGGKSAQLVSINGAVNAPGGIDIKAKSVSVGASGVLNTGKAGLDAIPGVSADWLVSTAGLTTGQTIVARDGGISIVADGDVTLAAKDVSDSLHPIAGATLDARPGSYAATAGAQAFAGGVTVTSGGTLQALGGMSVTVAGVTTRSGGIIAWDGVSAAAGDITLSSSQSATYDDSAAGIALSTFFGMPKTATEIDTGGNIIGGTVSIAATATSSTETPAFDPARLGLQLLIDKGLGKIIGLTGLGLEAFVSLVDAKTVVSIGADSTIRAKGDLTVSAASKAAGAATAKAKTPSGAGAGAAVAALAVTYSSLSSTAAVTVGGQLTADGKISVAATNVANASSTATAVSSEGAIAGSVAFQEANVQANVTLAATAALSGKSLAVSATNTQPLKADGTPDTSKGFVVGANTITTGKAAGGATAAVSKLDIGAAIDSQANLTATGGDISVSAQTITNRDIVTASAGLGDGFIADLKSVTTGVDAPTLLGEAFDRIDTKLSKTPGKKPGATPGTRVTAAVGVALVEQSATTSISGGVSATGNVTVEGVVKDTLARNNVSASTTTERINSGQATTIAGAAAWGSYDYTSGATMAGRVNAAGLTVNADTERPRGDNYPNPFAGPQSGGVDDLLSWVKGGILPKIGGSLGIASGFFGSSAGATAKNDGTAEPTVGASFSFSDIDAKATAWVDAGSVLTLGLGGLNILANAYVENLSLAGPIDLIPLDSNGLKVPGIGVKAGGAGVGGAAAYNQTAPVAIAGIDDGVRLVRSDAKADASVLATATAKLITIAPLAGQGGDGTLTGTFAINEVTGKTHATIAKTAALDLGTGKLSLGATTDLELSAIAGSLSYNKASGSQQRATAASVGVAGALNYDDMDTSATVGDAGGDDPTADGALTPLTAPGITAGQVEALATVTGGINAISVAGVANNTSQSAPPPAEKPPSDDDIFSFLTTKFVLYELLVPKFADKYLTEREFAQQARGIQDEMADADAKAAGTPVTKGFGLAGSASINLSMLTTKVDLSGAKFTRTGTGPAAFLARAVEGVDLVAVTGGAALATGSKPLENSKVLAGAFGLSYTDNETGSALSGTTLTGFDTVNVEGASNGTRVAAGLSLAVDTTKTTDGKVVAGSASILISEDSAYATVDGGSITGQTGNSGAVSLLAYDGLAMGAGAGGLAWGSSTQFGAAITAIVVASPNAASAKLTNTAVSNYGNLSVRSLTAASIAGVAAAGSASVGAETAQGGAASLSFNSVTQNATALVDLGTTGAANVNISGTLTAYAGDLTDIAPAVAGMGTAPAASRLNFLQNYSASSSDFDSDSGITDDDLRSGTRILSIAAAAAVGNSTSKDAGLALSVDLIGSNRTATILGGGTSSLKAGGISVRAIDKSSIVSIAAGIAKGGQGAVGSMAVNLITGTTSAGLQGGEGGMGNLAVTIGAAGATPTAPNLTIDAQGNGRILNLTGAVVIADKSAGGLAIGVNEITRASAASDSNASVQADDAGVHASLENLTLDGSPDALVSASTNGTITALSIAGAVSKDLSVAGAATANRLAPVVVAHAGNLDYVTATKGDLKITAADNSTIGSIALYLAAAKTAVAAGISVNQIDTRVAATLDEAQVRTLTLARAANLLPLHPTLVDLGLDPVADANVTAITIKTLPASGQLVLRIAGQPDLVLKAGDIVSRAAITAGQLTYLVDPARPTAAVSLAFAPNARIAVRDLLVKAAATATTRSTGIGVAVGGELAGAGSIAVNVTNARADALVHLGGADIVTTGSAGVIATRDSTIDAGAGTIAFTEKGAAIGASIVVADVGGGASAMLTGTTGAATLTAAGTAGSGIAGVRSGDIGGLAQFSAFNPFTSYAETPITITTATKRGVVVNASSTHASRTVAITGAIATSAGVAAAATAVIGNVGGDTQANVSNVDIRTGDIGAAAPVKSAALSVDIGASTQVQGTTFAGAIAASAGNGALAAPVVSDGFSATTNASMTGGSVRTTGDLTVHATGNQSATELALAGGIAKGVGISLAGVSPRFQSATSASVTNPTALTALNGIAVKADSEATALATFGTLAVGGDAAAAAAIVVVTNENSTSATYTGLTASPAGPGIVTVVAPTVDITAKGEFDATVAGASIAASAKGSLVGNGVGIVHRGTVSALADGADLPEQRWHPERHRAGNRLVQAFRRPSGDHGDAL